MKKPKLENTIIHLIGFPGTGKYTIAKEIVKMADVRMVDNHTVNNVIFNLIQADGITPLPELVWKYTRRIWDAVQDTMVHLSPREYNFILTNVCLKDDHQDHVHLNNFELVAEMRQGSYVPIRLTLADISEHKKRITSADRATRFKEINPDTPEKYAKTKQLIQIDHPNVLTLDVTHLTAFEAAEIILKHAISKHG